MLRLLSGWRGRRPLKCDLHVSEYFHVSELFLSARLAYWRQRPYMTGVHPLKTMF
jgi:hypothetical protein